MKLTHKRCNPLAATFKLADIPVRKLVLITRRPGARTKPTTWLAYRPGHPVPGSDAPALHNVSEGSYWMNAHGDLDRELGSNTAAIDIVTHCEVIV